MELFDYVKAPLYAYLAEHMREIIANRPSAIVAMYVLMPNGK